MRDVHYIPDCGKRMRDVLNEKNISITEMSRATGMSRTTIYQFVLEGRNTNVRCLAKMCAYAGVSADYIMGLTVKENRRNGKRVPTAVYRGDKCLGVFPSLKSASEFAQVTVASASRVLNGMYKTTKGFSFKEAVI